MTSPSSPCNGLASVLAALALGLSISAMALTAPASAEQANPLLGKGVEVTALNSVQMNDVQGTGYCPYNDCGRAGIEEAYEAYKAGYEAYYNYRGTSSETYYYGRAKDHAYKAYEYFRGKICSCNPTT